MSGAVLVAVAAAVGNLLQGWDNATIAGNIQIQTCFKGITWFFVVIFIIKSRIL